MSNSSPMRFVRKQVFSATQEDLAQIGGVNRSSVSRYESGKEDPPYRFLTRLLADAKRRGIKLPADWFFETPPEAANCGKRQQGKAA